MSDRRARVSVRAAAARIVAQVVATGVAIEAAIETVDFADRRDAALLRALVSGALRWHHRLDAWLAALVDGSRRRVQPEVRALVHIGLLQLTELRIPDHAAVDATVAATAELGLGRARGFVNALLRRFLRERAVLTAATDPVSRYSHPQWLIDAIRADWPDDWEAVLAANNELAPLWLRVNLRRVDRDDYLARLARAGIEGRSGDQSAAAVRLATPVSTAELPGFADGLVAVQDAAPQLAAGLLDLVPGARVLDACAAPCGKTAHMLETCPGLAEVVAVDRDAARLERGRKELARLGHSATLVAADVVATGDWWDGRHFDRILLDAPCTATGVIRRHPEIKLHRSPADVGRAQALQAAMLAALWPLLQPGGRLVYSTCSVLNAENRAVVAAFSAGRADCACPPFGSPGHFRVRPGKADMDGFYYACLTKAAGSAQ